MSSCVRDVSVVLGESLFLPLTSLTFTSAVFGLAGAYTGHPQVPFTPQNFNPPTTIMGGGATMMLPDRGHVQGGQSMCNMQQDQGTMKQVTHKRFIIMSFSAVDACLV